MCIVSNVSDSVGKQWPLPEPFDKYPKKWPGVLPLIPHKPVEDLDVEDIESIRKAYREAIRIDSELNEEACVDPDKVVVVDRLIARVFKIVDVMEDEDLTMDFMERLANLVADLREIKVHFIEEEMNV